MRPAAPKPLNPQHLLQGRALKMSNEVPLDVCRELWALVHELLKNSRSPVLNSLDFYVNMDGPMEAGYLYLAVQEVRLAKVHVGSVLHIVLPEMSCALLR